MESGVGHADKQNAGTAQPAASQELLDKYKAYENSKELVKDDNPYSRLYALKKMGLIENYEDITKKTVLVVGVGGVGSVTCEMLIRMGIGKVVMFDYDKVELANMNRLFYTPDQVGLTKVEAARLTLEKINPRVVLEAFNGNITSSEYYEILCDKIVRGGLQGQRADLVLSCVDNYAARMSINRACNELDQVWIESGVSENAMSCHIQLIVPGETSCFSCIPPLALIENNEHKIKREGVCAASLPTTMGITAGFLAHTAMKLLLDYEEVSLHLQYNAKKEFFSNSIYPPNPECKDPFCLDRQAQKKLPGSVKLLEERKARQTEKQKSEPKIPQQSQEEVDKWGIELHDDSNKASASESPTKVISSQSTENQSKNLDDLMAQLNQM